MYLEDLIDQWLCLGCAGCCRPASLGSFWRVQFPPGNDKHTFAVRIVAGEKENRGKAWLPSSHQNY